jgi:2-hydroxychromene-2-carboxylate isomerase
MSLSFALTYDYRCPFARIAHEHVLDGLADGADWDVTFVPFSLGQAHVEEGGTDVWDEPEKESGLLALQVSVAVRDSQPEHFLALHRALFEARHGQSADLRDEAVVRAALEAAGAGADADAAFAEVAGGGPLDTVRKEHEQSVADYEVFGVPTFIAGGRAVFVRLMDRPRDPEHARTTIERTLDLTTGWLELNELKQTTIGR